MCKTNGHTAPSKHVETIFSVELDIHMSQLILIALEALYEAAKNPDLNFRRQIRKSQENFGFDSLPDMKLDSIGLTIDRIFDALMEKRFPKLPHEKLMDLDIDDMSDADIQAIVRDIELQHGAVDWEAL